MKKIVLIGFTQYALQNHLQTLTAILGNDVTVETMPVSQNQLKPIDADIAVCTSFIFIEYAKKYVKNYTALLIAEYTLEKCTIREIEAMSKDGFISIVGVGYRIAASRKLLLEQLGIAGGAMNIWYEDLEPEQLSQNVVVFDKAVVPDPGRHRIISVHSRMLSVFTVIRIILALGQTEVLSSHEFLTYHQTVCPLDNLPAMEGRGESRPPFWNESSVCGSLSFTSEYLIAMCDNYIETVTGLPHTMLVEKTIYEVFPFFKKYISEGSLKEYGERIEKYKGKNYIVDVNLLELHEAFIGYIKISDYLQEERRQNSLRRQISAKNYAAKYSFTDIVGKSVEIINCKNIAMKAAGSNASTLIIGETGTGKELFAQAIHSASDRRDYPFVAINCGAIVASLLESELFGYERGAFTGAKKEGKAGLFELAHKGTLFLDEIGDMPLELQVKLLRTLQEKEIVRVGGEEIIPVDVRVVAATNKDLYALIECEKFRADLFYRINVLSIMIPPLRQRRTDIRDLICHQIFKKEYSFIISPEAMKTILDYPFKGNIRELQNCIDYMDSLGLTCVEKKDLPHYMLAEPVYPTTGSEAKLTDDIFYSLDQDALDDLWSVLAAISQIQELGLGAGRRTVTSLLNSRGSHLSERRVREMLRILNEGELIIIHAGRRGVELTAQGRQMVKKKNY